MADDHERVADYKFRAEFKRENAAGFELTCQLFLPTRAGEELRLEATPSESRFMSLVGSSFQLKSESVQGEAEVRISGEEVHFVRGRGRVLGDGLLDEGLLVCRPRELRVTRLLSGQNTEWHCEFLIANSKLLEPKISPFLDLDGSIDWRKGDRLRLELTEGFSLEFDHLFRCGRSPGNALLVWWDLVARASARTGDTSFEPERALADVDDLLLLVSLAEARSCACLELWWSDGEQSTRLFRDRFVPPQTKTPSIQEFLIRPSDIKEFLETTFRA